ncbi:MAG: enoyl-CoA hydratase [Pseudomonadales bacterium]|jgi:enoyl-CoA hydratase|nr:enoyl-CoA hydratase [Pseudomonadales bacterium]
MSEPLVRVERDAGVTTVTLNRPDALNALSTALRQEIVRTFRALKDDVTTEVVVLTGAGRAFTAGLDLKELGGETTDGAAAGEAVNDTDLGAALEGFGKPIIGAINGYAITGGFELALMCDILVCGESARFADTHARVGIVPGWGLSQKLPRLIGLPRAKELSLTGNFLSAERAYEWGMVNRVVPDGELLEVALGIARDILTTEPTTRLTVKRIMDEGWHRTLGEGMAIEDAASRAHMRENVTPDQVAERRAGIQQRGRQQG